MLSHRSYEPAVPEGYTVRTKAKKALSTFAFLVPLSPGPLPHLAFPQSVFADIPVEVFPVAFYFPRWIQLQIDFGFPNPF